MGITATDKAGRAVTEGDTDRTGLMCTAYRERRWLVGNGRSELCHRGEKHDLPRG